VHQKMWKVFLQTGNVEAYLLLKKWKLVMLTDRMNQT